MKLKKTKLLELTRNRLNGLGYVYLKDSLTGAEGLFAKPIANGLILTLGMTVSRFYDTNFTASYYLSKSTRWSSIWGDIPAESDQRVGFF